MAKHFRKLAFAGIIAKLASRRREAGSGIKGKNFRKYRDWKRVNQKN